MDENERKELMRAFAKAHVSMLAQIAAGIVKARPGEVEEREAWLMKFLSDGEGLVTEAATVEAGAVRAALAGLREAVAVAVVLLVLAACGVPAFAQRPSSQPEPRGRGCTWMTESECGPAPGERTCWWPDWNGDWINHCEDEPASRRRPAAAPDWSRRRPVTEPTWSREPAPRYRRDPLPSYRRESEPRGREYRRESGAITVNAVLCGTSEQTWRRALQEASAQVEAAGGGGFREGAITRGCPRGFGDLPRMGDGVTFGVFAQLRSVSAICGGGATGCGQMPGVAGVAYVAGNWWDPSTIIHEIGHMAGLGHTAGHDIMAPQAAEGQRVGAAYVRAVSGMGRRGNAYLPPGRIVQ